MTVEELQVLITANTKQLQDELNATKLQLNKFEKNVNSTTTKIAGFFKKMIPVAAIVLGIKKLASSSEQAYKDQIQNETRLLAVMTRLSDATNNDVKDILRLTEAEQAYGVVADEVQLAGAQELATYVDKADSIKKLIPQLNNMVTQQYGYNATQEEAINIATMMGKVLEGQTGALSRYGYYFDENQEKILKFGTEEEKVATLTEIIHDSIGDVNQALGDTAIGKQIQLANAWSDVKEQLGFVIVQVKQVLVPVFQVLVSWLGTAVSYLRQFLQLLGFSAQKQNNANKAIIGGASAEKSYGDAVEDTTKKQKEQLSSFDEMNVLKEDTSSDSSSSGGASDYGATGGINNIDFNVGIDGDVEVSEKVEKFTNLVVEKFNKLKEIMQLAWDSEPVQAFVGFAKTAGNYLLNYWSTIGTNLINNMQTTWSNVSGNMSDTLNNMSTLWTNFWNDLSAGIETWGQPITDGVSSLFNSIWADAIDPALQFITQSWSDFSGILVNLWDEHGATLVNNIGEFVDKTISLFKKIWDDVLEPIITPFLETLSWLWDKHIKGLIEEVGDFIGELVNGAIEIYNKFIEPIVGFLLDVLAPAWSVLSNFIVGVLGTLVAAITDIVKGIIKIFKGIVEFITGIFTGDWKKAWQGIKDIFGGIIQGLVGIFKAPINLIIDGINSFIAGLNKIKIPDWVPAVGGKGFHIEKLQKLGQGGIAEKPTPVWVGDAGKEVIMPLERNTEWIDDLASKINTSNGSGQSINLTVQIGDEQVASKFIDLLQEKQFETNGEVVIGL